MTPSSLLPYETWIEEALRGVIRQALAYTAEHGLVGSHHFYLTFMASAPGVEMPDWLRSKYPDELTIVLQHQFWDLVVDDEAFAVSVRFHGRSARLRVPFAAVQAFGDPGVNFGLQLHALPSAAGRRQDGSPADDSAASAARRTSADNADSGDVIALDRFRKK